MIQSTTVALELTEVELSLVLIVVGREAKAEAARHARMISRPAGTHTPEAIASARLNADLYGDLRDKLESS